MIWKFVLERRELQEIQMPKGCRILSLQAQAGKPCLWAAFEHHNSNYFNRDEETRTFFTVGTGEHVTHSLSCLTFLGTYQLSNGDEVYHVFEKT